MLIVNKNSGRFGLLAVSLSVLSPLVATGPAAAARLPWSQSQPQAESALGIRVVVTIAPLAGIVRGLLPEGTPVTVLMNPSRSEHGYEFTPDEMASLAKSDVAVYVGLGLEPKVASFLSTHGGGKQIVEIAAALKIEGAADADHHDHAEDGHDHDHDHDHGNGIDPHLWLDPVLMKQAVPSIRAALESALRAHGKTAWIDSGGLDAAEKALVARIDAVDAAYRERLGPYAGAAIVTHHAAFGRIAERYGLRIASVIRPMESVEPSPKEIAELVGAIREQRVRAIFVEPQFTPQVATRLSAAAKIPLGKLDPIGSEDWFGLMQRNLDQLVATLGTP